MYISTPKICGKFYIYLCIYLWQVNTVDNLNIMRCCPSPVAVREGLVNRHWKLPSVLLVRWAVPTFRSYHFNFKNIYPWQVKVQLRITLKYRIKGAHRIRWRTSNLNFRWHYLENCLSDILENWCANSSHCPLFAHRISSKSNEPFPRYCHRKSAKKILTSNKGRALYSVF